MDHNLNVEYKTVTFQGDNIGKKSRRSWIW